MRIEELSEDFGPVAAYLDRTEPELHAEAANGIRRWVAIHDDDVVGVASGIRRPDGKLFLSMRTVQPSSRASLVAAASAALDTPLYATSPETDEVTLSAFRAARFMTDFVSASFSIDFGRALDALARAWVPAGFEIRRADEVDEDRLFVLDNDLRSDVRGTEGWTGNREWFASELHDDNAFDPNAYLVAVHERGTYAALVRVWRNPQGPRIGLIGVRREFRGSTLAAALLQQALTAASTWGFDTFETESANPIVLRALDRIGAQPTGRTIHLVRR